MWSTVTFRFSLGAQLQKKNNTSKKEGKYNVVTVPPFFNYSTLDYPWCSQTLPYAIHQFYGYL